MTSRGCCYLMATLWELLNIIWMMSLRNIKISQKILYKQLRKKKFLSFYLSHHSKHLTKQLKFCINKFYGIFNVTIVFQNTRRIKYFFPWKDKLAPSSRSKVVYRANCWDCNDFIGKTKRRLRDRKTEHFKALTTNCHESAIADHVFLTNHRIKWNHFEMLAYAL